MPEETGWAGRISNRELKLEGSLYGASPDLVGISNRELKLYDPHAWIEIVDEKTGISNRELKRCSGVLPLSSWTLTFGLFASQTEN